MKRRLYPILAAALLLLAAACLAAWPLSLRRTRGLSATWGGPYVMIGYLDGAAFVVWGDVHRTTSGLSSFAEPPTRAEDLPSSHGWGRLRVFVASVGGRGVAAPLWLVAALAAALGLWTLHRWRCLPPPAQGLCPVCGYDLRGSRGVASTGCPECGAKQDPAGAMMRQLIAALLRRQAPLSRHA